jgi:uncharacterized membrane protein
MGKFDNTDKKIRNVALIVTAIAILLLILWVISYMVSRENAYPVLMAIGIALLLAGILLVTRIQYVIWMQKRFNYDGM